MDFRERDQSMDLQPVEYVQYCRALVSFRQEKNTNFL